jgi:TM2 domain-containing membrane protein YozV
MTDGRDESRDGSAVDDDPDHTESDDPEWVPSETVDTDETGESDRTATDTDRTGGGADAGSSPGTDSTTDLPANRPHERSAAESGRGAGDTTTDRYADESGPNSDGAGPRGRGATGPQGGPTGSQRGGAGPNNAGTGAHGGPSPGHQGDSGAPQATPGTGPQQPPANGPAEQPPGGASKFCTECGARIDQRAVVCPQCGVEQPDRGGAAGHAAPAGQSGSSGDPGVAALLSALGLLFPIATGAGQVYNDQVGKGILFSVVQIINVVLIFVLVGLLTYPLVGIWAIVDAYSNAK